MAIPLVALRKTKSKLFRDQKRHAIILIIRNIAPT